MRGPRGPEPGGEISPQALRHRRLTLGIEVDGVEEQLVLALELVVVIQEDHVCICGREIPEYEHGGREFLGLGAVDDINGWNIEQEERAALGANKAGGLLEQGEIVSVEGDLAETALTDCLLEPGDVHLAELKVVPFPQITSQREPDS